MDRSSPLLRVAGVGKRFGGVHALQDVSFEVFPNELVALIGPNGSGKSTLFNCITGELQPSSGAILVGKQNVVGWPVNRIARLGVTRTYQDTLVFPRLTVRENLQIAGQEHQGNGLLRTLFSAPSVRRGERDLETRLAETLDLIRLRKQAEEYAGDISYGQRKILALGMALMAGPRLLLLDEPTAAVNPTLINEMLRIVAEFHARAHTILLVEHNLPVVMQLAQRIVVLSGGRKLMEGPPAEVRRDPRVIEAYFGG